jgi:hypothetical protein
VDISLRRSFAVAGALLILSALPACTSKAEEAGSPNTSGPPAAGSLSAAATTPSAESVSIDGTWKGTWTRTSPPPSSGTMTLVLHHSGQSVTGQVEVVASACLTKGNVTGTVAGTKVTLHAVTPAVNGTGQATGDYEATLSGSKLGGSLTVTCSVGTGVGTWDLSRQ